MTESQVPLPPSPGSRVSMVPYRPTRIPEAEMLQRGRDAHERMSRRRSVRLFSSDPVPRACIEWAIRCAGTAPSGAHRQPWRFVAVANPNVKRKIREAAGPREL